MTVHYSDEAVTLHLGDCLDVLTELPDASIDSVVTDPPYGLANTDPAHVTDALVRWINGERDFMPEGAGFMGKSWDAFVPPPAVWDECIRVLKPGGHLLCFAGTRTVDLMGLSIRLAGFEIRDSLAWIYGSGFPKSLDVGKAIDKMRDDRDEILAVTTQIKALRDEAGMTNRQLDDLFEFAGMAGHWTSTKSQPSVPTVEQWAKLREVLSPPAELDAEVWRLNGRKGTPGHERPDRIVSLPGNNAVFQPTQRVENKGTPVLEEAQQWQGWGTALKPAFEPVIVARKPFPGTVATNVLTHGTGALNIDGTRVGTDEDTSRAPAVVGDTAAPFGKGFAFGGRGSPAGRWPANVLLDEGMAARLDQEVGTLTSGKMLPPKPKGGNRNTYGQDAAAGYTTMETYGDSGGPSRFFPVFRYQAKAPTSERPSYEREGAGNGRVTGLGGKVRQCNMCETRAIESGASEPSCGHGDFRWEEPATEPSSKVAHATVKPLALMRWLVKLVTPPVTTTLVCLECDADLPGVPAKVHAEPQKPSGVRDSVSTEGGRPGEEDPPAAVPAVREADHGEDPEVLQHAVPGRSSKAADEAVSAMRGDVQAQAELPEVLLEAVRGSGDGSTREALRALRSDVPAPLDEVPVLFEDLRRKDVRDGEAQGAEHQQPGLRPAVRAGSPDGDAHGVSARASEGGSGLHRPDADLGRGRSPHQRDQDGQSSGEPARPVEAGARPDPEAGAEADRVPPLRRQDRSVGSCASCGGALTEITRPGVILEPFAGSGTTVEAAILEGFRCVAIEREADYLPLIRQRIDRAHTQAATTPTADPTLFDEESA